MISFLRKALAAMRHAGRPAVFANTLARTSFNYAKEVGDGIDASVVMAPVQWVQRAFPEAPLTLFREKAGEREALPDHALTELIARPNEYYDGVALFSATLLSYLTAGNAYWLKVRNGLGRPVELWYLPHWTIGPKWPEDGSEFISHYEYRPGGVAPIPLQPEDVVHFRHGIDPRNVRLGLAPLHATIREIFMDLESSNFAATLLRNLGVPGLVLTPETGVQADPEDVAAVKTWLREAFQGDRRGQPLVLGTAAKVQEYGFNPKQMDLSVTRNVAEERVCACLGIPAAVVGFGAGLQTAKVGATMEELRKLAWTNGIIPVQRALAGEIERALLPDFESAPEGFELEFDASELVALEDDLTKREARWLARVKAGVARVDEAREAMGLDVEPADRIYLRPFSAIEVPAGQSIGDRTPAPAAGQAALDMRGLLGKTEKQRHGRRAAQQAYVVALERMAGRLARALEPRLSGFFDQLGREAAAAAGPLLAEFEAASGETGEAAGARPSNKQTGEDQVLIGRVLEQLELPLRQAAFRRLYEAHYLTVAEEVGRAAGLVGLATDLPDPVARAVVAAGGRRAGLVDLAEQSRRALFAALEEGRAAGEGVEQLTARIRGQVGGGPWHDPETRARTIARTETKYAQNVSTVARAQHEGIERFVVFDGRLGEGRSDPTHIARDGSIVSAAEAEQMATEEHPNGTLSFAPHIEEE